MSVARFWFLILGLLFSPVFSFSAEVLSLKESLERAFSNNVRLLVAKKDLSITQAQLREAKSLFYPKVHLNLDYVRYRHETLGLTPPELGNLVLEAPIANPSGVRSNPLEENLYLGRLGFVQTLYAGGKLNYTYKRSQASVKRAESAVETIKQDVALQTADLFYRSLTIQQKQNMFKDMLLRLERMTQSLTSVHSRLAVSSARAELRKELGDLKKQEQGTRFDYLRIMGLELFSDVKAQGSLETSETFEDVQTALVWARQNRAELRETVLQEEVDQLSVDLSLAERYPVFLLGGGVEVRNNEFPLDETNWNTVLSMNIPLFDGFSSRARIRESRYRADQGRLKRIQLEDQVEMEIRTAVADCEHWLREMKIRQQELQDLEKSKQRYLGSSRGGDSVQDRLDYVRWFVKTSSDFVQSQYEFCMAKARLSKAMGRSIQDN